jgi:hypothetical protein
MNTTLTILIIVFTALASVALVGGIFNAIFKKYFDNQQKTQLLQMKIDEHKESLKVITPIRLQAYERMALFLERISPNSLIMRCYQPGMNLKLLQGVMTKNIRDEWEHNLSQQIYISSDAWSRCRESKEEMINLINASAANLPRDADPGSLAGIIFENIAKNQIPTDHALEYLKKEIKERFD